VNLAWNLLETARARGDRAALRQADDVMPYARLDEDSARVTGLLKRRGVRPGDRVGLMLPNTVEFAVCYYGILRAGGVVVPMNPLLKAREVTYYLRDCEARLMFAWHASAAQAELGAKEVEAEVIVVEPASFGAMVADAQASADVVDRAADDTAVILFTSGTTGQPKGAELTHGNLTSNTRVVLDELLEIAGDDVIFGGLPLFHAFGQTCALNAAVAAGASLALLPRFSAEGALRLLEQHAVTVMVGVPTMYSALLHATDRSGYDTSRLQVCISGGAALPAEVLRAFEAAYDCMVLEGYGLSETSPVASFNHPHRPRKVGSIGTPIRGVEMKVVDDDGDDVPPGDSGEIVIRGPNVMKGYWRRPDATAAVMKGGWFHTGDVARVDEDGYFFIVGRKKDMIIRGGYNVYPREIEEVLHEHPAVAEAAVFGMPHPDLGEEVGAVVVLKPGADATADDLREHVKGQVAAYKYPRKLWVVDELPKGPTGKIHKHEIVPPSGSGQA